MPWWSEHEDRTVIFLAHSVRQKVTFYAAVDSIPTLYRDIWLDDNEMYAVQPTDKGYLAPSPTTGNAYYVRIRANYSLSAYVDHTPYQFYFWAFSQPSGYNVQDIYANEQKIGVAFLG